MSNIRFSVRFGVAAGVPGEPGTGGTAGAGVTAILESTAVKIVWKIDSAITMKKL